MILKRWEFCQVIFKAGLSKIVISPNKFRDRRFRIFLLMESVLG